MTARRATVAALVAVTLLGGIFTAAAWEPRQAPPEPTIGARFAVPLVPPATPPVSRRVIHVQAEADPGGEGSKTRPFATIQEALDRAFPGDSIVIGKGRYSGPVTTVRAGRQDAPIRLIGDGARLVGDGDGRLVQILHSHVTLEGLDISRADILIWVADATGVKILGNRLHNAQGECVRLKYRARDNEVAGNHIDDCGREGFDLDADSKNGEGVYIGTAPEQLDRNPTGEADTSDGNWIHDNVISTPAECVDIKEGASGNLVEHNTCTDGRDPEGAGFSSRGSSNTFAYNLSRGHAGAGIRLGGDERDDGTGNVVYGNRLSDNDGYGVKIQRLPQGAICENELSDNDKGPTNEENGPADAKCPQGAKRTRRQSTA